MGLATTRGKRLGEILLRNNVDSLDFILVEVEDGLYVEDVNSRISRISTGIFE